MSEGNDVGRRLAEQLGLRTDKTEGHDLVGPCVACKSSDAFRLHIETGVAHCFSCGGSWSPFTLAELVLADREKAKALLVDLGVFQPIAHGGGQAHSTLTDPIEAIARQKGVTTTSFKDFGAKAVSSTKIQFPVYGPDGTACSAFSLTTDGEKGKFAHGKKAGLFFPHVDESVRLPKIGETWHLVEGVKDAAALHDLDLLSCGMNTCRLAAKFARLFAGVEIITILDRDVAGEKARIIPLESCAERRSRFESRCYRPN